MTEPIIELLSFTNFPLETAAYAWESMQNILPDTLEEYKNEHDATYFDSKFKEIMKDGVGTPAEFVNTNWVFKNVSRAFQQQLTRYRLASFSIQTLRRVDVGSFATNRMYHMPPGMDKFHQEQFHMTMLETQGAYLGMLHSGASIENARGILPLNIYSTITMSCNIRSLANIVKQRLCTHAQAEWKEIVKQMEEQVREKMPAVIADELFQPSCVKIGKCFVPDRCCGKVNSNE